MINLIFHDIAKSPDMYDLEEKQFFDLIEAIRKNYQEKNFRIYFDDGKISANRYANWLKRNTRFPVICAVVAGDVGKPGYLSARQVRKLFQAGIGIASHGFSHAALAVSKSLDDRHTPAAGKYVNSPPGVDQRLSENQVLFQYLESKKLLEKLGLIIEEFVFPYGLYNNDSIIINNKNKIYSILSTCDPQIDNGQSLRPRILVDKSMTATMLTGEIEQLASQ